jgi:hypothetical protein
MHTSLYVLTCENTELHSEGKHNTMAQFRREIKGESTARTFRQMVRISSHNDILNIIPET